MITVVVTGSTRGIGFGMAGEFLKRGCNVVVSGRSQAAVDHALSQLNGGDRVLGVPCEISDEAQVQALWDRSAAHFGRVDFWINNAGIDIPRKRYDEIPFDEVRRIVQINLLGMMHASHVAVRGMLAQGSGQLFNMEGFGSEGRKQFGMTSYGTTKYGLRYFTQSLQAELKDTPVLVGTLSPGIVITDLLMDDYKDRPAEELARAKRIFNILADKVETVAPYLVEKTLANTRQNAAIAWLTTPKIIGRFMTSPLKKRDLFAEA
jgi:NAD(P)-dependent dehydrogenase (short-subunit alcohol dehydrogenase family)